MAPSKLSTERLRSAPRRHQRKGCSEPAPTVTRSQRLDMCASRSEKVGAVLSGAETAAAGSPWPGSWRVGPWHH